MMGRSFAPCPFDSLSGCATGLLSHLPLSSGKRLVLIGSLLIGLGEVITMSRHRAFEIDVSHSLVEFCLLLVVGSVLVVILGDHLVVTRGFGVLYLLV